MSIYSLAAYWGPREESLDSCADRLQRLLRGLSRADIRVRRWRPIARGRARAAQPAPDLTDTRVLRELLEEGRNRRDDNGEVIPELGFTCCLRSGRRIEDSLGLSFQCSSTVPRVPNAVVIGFPPELGRFASPTVIGEIISAVVEASDPEWAEVLTIRSRESPPGEYVPPERIDWIIYLSRRKFSLSPIPEPATVTDLGEHGWIVTVQQDPPNPENPEHRRNSERVRAALGMPSFP
jgi:hypothetical protein